MAEAVGISPSSAGRIWAEAGLKPHLTRGFKVSNDPRSMPVIRHGRRGSDTGKNHRVSYPDIDTPGIRWESSVRWERLV